MVREIVKEEVPVQAKEEVPKVTVESLLMEHEQRIQALEATLYRLKNI